MEPSFMRRSRGIAARNRCGKAGPGSGLVHLVSLFALLSCGPRLLSAEKGLVVSVYQGTCAEGDFATNLATVRKVVAQATERGSHFVAFPECFLSGYESPEAVQHGARPLDDPQLTQFVAESAKHDLVILVGMARKARDGLYNTVLVIHHGKLMGLYDKVMLTGGDRDALGFKPGTAMPVFSAHGAKFAVIICHDSSFPEAAMAARLQGAEILFSPHYNEIGTATVDEHRLSVRNCHVGLATQLKMAVARANVVKTDRAGRVGYGDSFILSPLGTPLAEAGLFKTGLISARVTPAMFRSPWVWANHAETPGWLRTQVAQLLTDFRRPSNGEELRFWLENMTAFHGYSPEEISAATGLTLAEIAGERKRLNLDSTGRPSRTPADPLLIKPYPGGRHPRIGFLEGAVAPQRETKVSVFTPWDDASYVVVDVPEAIFSNLGLLYLAHTHVPTIWEQKGVSLPRLEWNRRVDGSLDIERPLPNGVVFGAKVVPTSTEVRMELWLRNGTSETLTGLRVQNCVMLARAAGFSAQSNVNKVFRPPFATARSEDGRRWIITAWTPTQRCWGNEPCPCLHADPQFPDCPPGQTVRVRGWLSFHEGDTIEGELERIGRSGWLQQ
ncbi:MAG: carbon-nitrogen hydrolase family protein [Isosphaeraceae bacterium]